MWTAAPVIWLSFAGYGYWIASIKRRNPGEGTILGLLLGPIGCVFEATLRERTSEEIDQERSGVNRRRRSDSKSSVNTKPTFRLRLQNSQGSPSPC